MLAREQCWPLSWLRAAPALLLGDSLYSTQRLPTTRRELPQLYLTEGHGLAPLLRLLNALARAGRTWALLEVACVHFPKLCTYKDMACLLLLLLLPTRGGALTRQ